MRRLLLLALVSLMGMPYTVLMPAMARETLGEGRGRERDCASRLAFPTHWLVKGLLFNHTFRPLTRGPHPPLSR